MVPKGLQGVLGAFRSVWGPQGVSDGFKECQGHLKEAQIPGHLKFISGALRSVLGSLRQGRFGECLGRFNGPLGNKILFILFSDANIMMDPGMPFLHAVPQLDLDPVARSYSNL